MKILLLNAGSSSLKSTLIDGDDQRVLCSGLADWAGSHSLNRFVGLNGQEECEEVQWSGHAEAVRHFIGKLLTGVLTDPSSLSAVGHRVVHGGEFSESVLVTPNVRSRISALADLAPLHNPQSLETLAAAESELPSVPHIAVFDTAFHATLPPEAFTYPVPQTWTDDWGIRRFGFHGLSHAYCARRTSEMLGRPLSDLRIVSCHLGHGCSAAAVQAGRCVDTTMGFTPLDGLMMATRCGAIDPSIVLHVQQHHGLTAAEVETTLNRKSGLLGVSGVSGDMREILAAVRDGNADATLALSMYVHRLKQTIGAMAATMGGIDALVFTAGVGEHASEVRESVCTGLQCLGLELDLTANRNCQCDQDVASMNSPARILVISTREDLTMLRDVVQVLNEHGLSSSMKSSAT